MPRKPAAAPQPLAEGRAYFKGRRGHYVRVLIFSNRSRADAWLRHHEGRGWPSDAAAFHSPYRKIRYSADGRERVLPELGTIYLCGPVIPHEFVAREAAHAVLNWTRIVGYGPTLCDPTHDEPGTRAFLSPNGPEERFCYALGHVVDQTHKLILSVSEAAK